MWTVAVLIRARQAKGFGRVFTGMLLILRISLWQCRFLCSCARTFVLKSTNRGPRRGCIRSCGEWRSAGLGLSNSPTYRPCLKAMTQRRVKRELWKVGVFAIPVCKGTRIRSLSERGRQSYLAACWQVHMFLYRETPPSLGT